jgi:hypothetical protein
MVTRASTVHAGTLQRWYEALCRIQHETLRSVVKDNLRGLKGRALPAEGGVYCFWWTGVLELLESSSCNRHIELVGPGGRAVTLEIDDEWLGTAAGLPIPLYVGKTADSIAKRAGQHLRMQDVRTTPLFEGTRKQPRPTTSCQLRAGVEHLFPQMSDSRALVLDNVGMSFVTLDGDEHAANRFYLEDLAVGLMRPALNIDIER